MSAWFEYLTYFLIIAIASVYGGPWGFLIAILVLHYIVTYRQDMDQPYKPKELDLPIHPVLTDEELLALHRDNYYRSDMLKVPRILHTQYAKYLKTDTWYKLRRKVLKRDSHRCTRCSYIGNLQVHHINYAGIFEMNFNIDQLESVCNECHSDIHTGILPMKKD